MSGGHYDYAYQSIDGFIRDFQYKANTPIRQAFLKQIARVSQAMHDIEWVDSGDYSEGDEDNAIIKCLGIGWRNIAYEQVLEEVKKFVILAENENQAKEIAIKKESYFKEFDVTVSKLTATGSPRIIHSSFNAG